MSTKFSMHTLLYKCSLVHVFAILMCVYCVIIVIVLWNKWHLSAEQMKTQQIVHSSIIHSFMTFSKYVFSVFFYKYIGVGKSHSHLVMHNIGSSYGFINSGVQIVFDDNELRA